MAHPGGETVNQQHDDASIWLPHAHAARLPLGQEALPTAQVRHGACTSVHWAAVPLQIRHV